MRDETPARYSWREDVWPRFQWAILVDALKLRQKEVAEGDHFPLGYGIAWRCWHRDAVVCMPVPLNVLAGAMRRLWIALQSGINPHRFETALITRRNERERAAREVERRYCTERLEGEKRRAYHDGWNAGRTALVDEILRDIQSRPLPPTADDGTPP